MTAPFFFEPSALMLRQSLNRVLYKELVYFGEPRHHPHKHRDNDSQQCCPDAQD
jgi:hypothetical protein